MVQGIGQHGQGIENREQPDQNHGNTAPDKPDTGKVKDKPRNGEWNNGNQGYPQCVYVRKESIGRNNGYCIQEGPEGDKNTQGKKTL